MNELERGQFEAAKARAWRAFAGFTDATDATWSASGVFLSTALLGPVVVTAAHVAREITVRLRANPKSVVLAAAPNLTGAGRPQGVVDAVEHVYDFDYFEGQAGPDVGLVRIHRDLLNCLDHEPFPESQLGRFNAKQPHLMLGCPADAHSNQSFLSLRGFVRDDVQLPGGRFAIDWSETNMLGSDVVARLPSPGGMSGGPVFCFADEPSGIWSVATALKLVGILFYHDDSQQVLHAEPSDAVCTRLASLSDA